MTLGELHDALKALTSREKALTELDSRYEGEDSAWQSVARYQERRQKLIQRIEELRKKELT